MKNWVLQNFLFSLKPSPANFIKARYSHFRFCQKTDPTLTPDLYLDNLAEEFSNDLRKQMSVNKTSLTYSLFQRILSDQKQRDKLIRLMQLDTISTEKIQHFLHSLNESVTEQSIAQSGASIPTKSDIAARTYIIAAHILLELNHNELHYETLIRDTTAMQQYIIAHFRPNNLSKRLSDMKGFNYKSLLKGKNNGSVKGQLKPQFKKIADNPDIFGQKVSAFADKVLKEHFDK